MRSCLALLSILGLVCGCSRQSPDGPPSVRYGQDECGLCGMILTDERHVAALRIVDDGQQRDVLFDDIGDMLKYERNHAPLEVRRRFVHDFETRQWIDAAVAAFVQSERIHTPMGSGIVAFADETRGRARAMQDGGQLVRLTLLQAPPRAANACCSQEEQ